MGRFKFQIWLAGSFWQKLRQKLNPDCPGDACIHAQGLWERLRRRPQRVLFEGSRYCIDRCLDKVLCEALGRLRSVSRPAPANHRVPLGLLLLQRQELTTEQLRQALASQRTAGQGRIGEWLQTLGFASGEQITAALAQQWSCPVLRAPSPKIWRIPRIPVSLLQWFVMFPVDYVSSSGTVHIAFSERIDYTVLYAIEQMLRCRTEPCLVAHSWLRQNLDKFAERRLDGEIVFDRMTDMVEFAHSICSYCQLTGVAEVRLACCGPHLWARLQSPDSPPLDLMLRLQLQRLGVANPDLAPASLPAV
jgi:Type II secretion system (T2SS), protein E, N-terminal domain